MPTFVMFDADANVKPEELSSTKMLNATLLKLCGVEDVDPCQSGGTSKSG